MNWHPDTLFAYFSLPTTEKMVERDYFMTSDEALRFGLIDKVLEHRDVKPEPINPAQPGAA